jgi:hypothetical protein
MGKKETDKPGVVHGKFGAANFAHFECRGLTIALKLVGRAVPFGASMVNAHPSEARDPRSVIRALKLLVAILVLSNVSVGIVGVYLLKVVDDRYTRLIERSVPLLNDLQTETAKLVEAMRSTNPVLHEVPEGRMASVTRGKAAFAADVALRAKILSVDWSSMQSELRDSLVSAGSEFTHVGYEVLALYAADQPAAAARLRETMLRPAFDRYMRATTKAADVVEYHSRRESDGFTEKTSSFVRALLGFAGWPVFLVVAGVLFSTSFAAVLLVAFRGKAPREFTAASSGERVS